MPELVAEMEQKLDHYPDGDQTALLQHAAEHGNTDAVCTIVLGAGSSVNINRRCDMSGKLPLYWSVYNGHLETTAALLSLGADVNGLSRVRHCLPLDLPSGDDQDGDLAILCENEPPLVTAVRGSNIPMVRLLLERDAHPNIKTQRYPPSNFTGKTALHIATNNVNVNVVKILLEGGASPELSDHRGESALFWAATSWCCCQRGGGPSDGGENYKRDHEGHRQVLQLLCDAAHNVACENPVPLLYAAAVRAECVERAEFFLHAGGDINFKPFLYPWVNETALHFAAHRNNTAMARFLINNGAILDVTDHYGETPLAKNIRFLLRSDIAAILIIHGASVAGKDRLDRSLIDACIGTRTRWSRTDHVVLCHLLVFAGYKVTRTYQRPHDKLRSEVEGVCDWLETTRHTPYRLDDLSRIFVRKFLSENVVQGRSIVQTVRDNLPKVIADYLLLKDIANIAL